MVGGGAAGTLTAVRLLDESARRHLPIQLTVVEPRAVLGRGVAYSASDPRHVLNVPAARMSAYPEDGEHFLRWLWRAGKVAEPADFVPRSWYGRYLDDQLAEAARRATAADLRVVRDRAVDISVVGERYRVSLASGETLAPADGVVLAIGHLGVDTSWAPPELVDSERFVADPWRPGALDAVAADADVLLVGSGLTMVDVAVCLDRPGRMQHVVSRSGQRPRSHARELLPLMEAPDFESERPDLDQLRSVMTRHVAKALDRYGDWRPAIDSIRAITPKLWAGLGDDDRATFIRHDARTWDSLRHRMSPDSAERIRCAHGAGRLDFRAASVSAVETAGGKLRVELSDGRTVEVGAVVNCTGPLDRPARSGDPLVAALLNRGLARPGPLGIGLDTDQNGRVVGGDGSASRPLFTLAALRKGVLWESTAMPEIRAQAVAVARCLAGEPSAIPVRPRDQYGLVLSTTADAADLWRQALDRIRTVQAGAPDLIAAAVEMDPGFALGHAALALLGRECEADVDVAGCLSAALDAIRLRGDAREISFVRMVEARLTGSRDTSDRALIRHVREHPTDCLAVSVALPTIAFSGVAQPIEDSWALVDALAPEYGTDWWFSSLLAFTRQEQDRWAEAEVLVERALSIEPAAGHAVHARAHVAYETGDHAAGRDWLDAWIGRYGGETNHRAHFAWHVALQEIALDDLDAALRRYREQLAPPAVTGARALVDSVSLLWRLRMLGADVSASQVESALAAVDSCGFDRPASTFAAMHAAIALAAGGDLAGLARLEAFAVGHESRSFAAAVAPLCRGLTAVASGRYADAIAPLTELRSAGLRRFGGSVAQQEVIEETLLHALGAAGRRDDAATLLAERAARRGSPLDRRRLAALK